MGDLEAPEVPKRRPGALGAPLGRWKSLPDPRGLSPDSSPPRSKGAPRRLPDGPKRVPDVPR
eukprot:3170278-Pyramimonas_sp.AAC.1